MSKGLLLACNGEYLNFIRLRIHWIVGFVTNWITPIDLAIISNYRQISYISRTKSQNLNVSRLVLQFSLHNQLKPGVKSRMKMQLEQRQQALLQLHMSDKQFYYILRYALY